MITLGFFKISFYGFKSLIMLLFRDEEEHREEDGEFGVCGLL